MRRLIMGNVSVTNELSSRPERSEVEGPAVLRTTRGNVFRRGTMALRPTQGDENGLKGTAFRVCVRTWFCIRARL
jgi:hypothetical protein